MDHIVDNLSTRNLTSFADIEPKLLDLAEKHTLDVDSTAYAANRYTKNETSKRGDSSKTQTRGNSTLSNSRKKSTTKDTRHVKKAKGNKASNAIIVQYSDSDTEVNAFTASMGTINAHGKRLREVSAYLDTLSSGSSLSNSWLFDSGTSRHMSGNIDDFVTLEPARGTITVAGQQKIPIEGQGTVRLTLVLPDGSTRFSELTNVLFSEQLKSTRLFSWPYVRNKGYEVQATGDHLYLTKLDGRYSLWATYKNGLMEIQTTNSTSTDANVSSASVTG
ncbi:hypothetical protein PTTW11_03279 [Pyrenophora teres f. teres]|uniref:Retrovirus-related Pol polyprotein from transposon TNT 1-94-like beta-barrel domain-containing protein n=1 Tax=Pyrenophora teres f. teres TaxID=97479 RepID=A0A6S6VTV3_9PLEO|nr:hypothetical protein PTTW11_03279 [Pyrenophora teres f. teres]